MVKLTPEQEDMIGDNVYHDKKLEEEENKEKKKHKMFPVNPKQLDKILKKIGRRKFD